MSAVQRRLSLALLPRGHGPSLQSSRARCLLLIFLNQTAHCVGRPGTSRKPVLDPVQLERAVVPLLFRIVSADHLEKFSVTWTAFIGHDDLIIWAIESALSAESN